MSIHQSIELFVILNFILLGLSHSIQPQIWIDFFRLLTSKGQAGNVANSLLALGTGSIIVPFHWVWSGPMTLVTVYGLALLSKGSLYLLLPSVGLKSIAQVDGKPKKLIAVGAIMVLLGIVLAFFWIRSF